MSPVLDLQGYSNAIRSNTDCPDRMLLNTYTMLCRWAQGTRNILCQCQQFCQCGCGYYECTRCRSEVFTCESRRLYGVCIHVHVHVYCNRTVRYIYTYIHVHVYCNHTVRYIYTCTCIQIYLIIPKVYTIQPG